MRFDHCKQRQLMIEYLFDDKGALLKDMIQLLENTLKNDDESYSEY